MGPAGLKGGGSERGSGIPLGFGSEKRTVTPKFSSLSLKGSNPETNPELLAKRTDQKLTKPRKEQKQNAKNPPRGPTADPLPKY